MKKDGRIYVAGAKTLVGTALVRVLAQQGYRNIGAQEEELDYTRADEVEDFFSRAAPEYVFIAAGRSAGIEANRRFPADLMHHNLLVACHVLHSAYRHGVKKLLYLASSCAYPKDCPQPMRVESLLTGPLEPTSEAYALAKLAGIKLSRAYRQEYGVNFISAIAADVFGPGDDFSAEDSHVVAALIRKMHEAKASVQESIDIWGTGSPRREFIFVDDVAKACVFLMERYDDPDPINIGLGADSSIKEIAEEIRSVVGYSGKLRFDTTKPDGMPAKLLDSSRLRSLGWKAETPLRAGLEGTYRWYVRTREEQGEDHVRTVL